MKRRLFGDEHREYRQLVATFLDKEVVGKHEQWEAAGIVPREVYRAAGETGLLGLAVPEEFGGAGITDFRYSVVFAEEAARVGANSFGLGVSLHTDIASPYFLAYATAEQRARWLPGIADGSLLTAIAMTEPAIGSDLAAMRTTALPDGDGYRLSGSKTFITNGINADLIIVAAKTDPSRRHDGISLLVVEADMTGFARGRNLDKLGLHAQDTAELFFDDVFVPAQNLLGTPGRGFAQLVDNLAQERLSIAVSAVAAAQAALTWTLDYVRSRTAFGRPVGSFQASRFRLAELATELDVARSFTDDCVRALADGELTAEDAAKAKWWCTEMQGRVVDACVQLHGGYGYMSEYPISRAFTDARITRIYGGTTEIMKEIVGRGLGLGDPR